MASLLNQSKVRALIDEARPGVRVSREFMESLEAHVRGDIVGYLRMNGSKKTLKADVFLGVPSNGRGRKR